MTKDPVKRRAQNTRYYQKNSQKTRIRHTTQVAANRMLVYRYLTEHPCACGESDPIVLEFDHNDPTIKIRPVSEMIVRGVSSETLLTEIAKCTVRCANCHRRKTAKARSWYRSMAPELGFEPRSPESESGILPLNDPGILPI